MTRPVRHGGDQQVREADCPDLPAAPQCGSPAELELDHTAGGDQARLDQQAQDGR